MHVRAHRDIRLISVGCGRAANTVRGSASTTGRDSPSSARICSCRHCSSWLHCAHLMICVRVAPALPTARSSTMHWSVTGCKDGFRWPADLIELKAYLRPVNTQ
eukprot:COSAG05_NODE_182_length_14772_cov_42.430655_19_plen_104_part_00